MVEQTVQGRRREPRCGGLSAALGDFDGASLAALDLMQHGLAGDAEALCGLGERNEAVGHVGTKRARISSVSRIRQGASGVVCSPGSSPSFSQRRIVNVDDAELLGGVLGS